MQHSQTARNVSERRPEMQNGSEQMQVLGSGQGFVRSTATRERYFASLWRVLAYELVCFAFLFVLAFAWLRPNVVPDDIADWKPLLALAEVAREKNELYVANGLYSQAGRLAARSDDWTGLLSAACGMGKLERQRGPYSPTRTLLVRAMVAAEARKSGKGLAAVADAFSSLGEDRMAARVRSRAQRDWPFDNADNVLPDCWAEANYEPAPAEDR